MQSAFITQRHTIIDVKIILTPPAEMNILRFAYNVKSWVGVHDATTDMRGK